MPKFMNVSVVVSGVRQFFSSNVVSSSDWEAIISSITNQISVSTVVGAIGVAIAAAIGLVFMWWGARKAVKVLMGAWKSGKLKF